MKPTLNYLEAKIIDICNLKCTACIPFSNVARDGQYELEQYELDLRRVSSLFSTVKEFRILGGEPLLSPEFNDYVVIARASFPETKISVVTNGILLYRIGESQMNCYRDNQIEFFISKYPIDKHRQQIAQQIERLRENHIKVTSYDAIYFFVNHDFSKAGIVDVNTESIYRTCRKTVDCTNIYMGKMYPCPKPFSLKHYNKAFNTRYSFEEDGIDIYHDKLDGNQILRQLDIPMSCCRICTQRKGVIPWSSFGTPDPYDWENTKNNQHLLSSESEDRQFFFNTGLTAISIYQEQGRYQMRLIEITVKSLQEISDFILIVEEEYNVSFLELFDLLRRKAKRTLLGAVCDPFYSDLLGVTRMTSDDIKEKQPKHILCLFSKQIQGWRYGAALVDKLSSAEMTI